MEDQHSQATELLKELRAGDAQAADKLLPLVYAELHRLASAYMRRERADHTLQPTALIHEAYLRLVDQPVDYNNRAHFLGFAAHVMRRVLVDYARAHRAEHRGGKRQRVELEDHMFIAPEQLEQAALVDEALTRLEQRNPRQARVVELRYFGGLSNEQIAETLGIAPRSVKRDWALARLWLFDELRNKSGHPEVPNT